ncbi:hypothetical protein CW304_00275 [Bacillus sp. UFRGS-B20]|nr:hypothetical protein CW304_00275 [Bacillus sp. UFRGS-B20]
MIWMVMAVREGPFRDWVYLRCGQYGAGGEGRRWGPPIQVVARSRGGSELESFTANEVWWVLE